MVNFIWKNRSSLDYGIIVTSLPPIVKPNKRVETIEIEGKDGDITNILGYSPYIKSLEIAFREKDVSIDFMQNWLNGESTITLSNEPDKFYNGIIIDNIEYKKVIHHIEANINVKVQPYKYSIKEIKATYTSPFEMLNSAYEDALPIITIHGSGLIHLVVNNVEVCQVNITDYITIDSSIEEAYKDTVTNLANRQMLGDFPILKSGKNTISWFGDTVNNVEIRYRNRWL